MKQTGLHRSSEKNSVKTGWLVRVESELQKPFKQEWLEEWSNGVMGWTPQGQKAWLQCMCCALAAKIVFLLFQKETEWSGTDDGVVQTSGI